jgi:hypothetical protein
MTAATVSVGYAQASRDTGSRPIAAARRFSLAAVGEAASLRKPPSSLRVKSAIGLIGVELLSGGSAALAHAALLSRWQTVVKETVDVPVPAVAPNLSGTTESRGPSFFPRRSPSSDSIEKSEQVWGRLVKPVLCDAVDLALPHYEHIKTQRPQSCDLGFVPPSIGSDFLDPKLGVAFRYRCSFAPQVAMPVAAVDEDSHSSATIDEVGRPGKTAIMAPITSP